NERTFGKVSVPKNAGRNLPDGAFLFTATLEIRHPALCVVIGLHASLITSCRAGSTRFHSIEAGFLDRYTPKNTPILKEI
ncbi:MAG: hypothetical protein KJN62_00455, partial [Deltaproteobacteria bacterium]|nr:hypothetical protein [Deltaproteobacteria bacterium]